MTTVSSQSSEMTPDEIRATFASQLSKMYRQEVPSYDTLLSLVEEVNQTVRKRDEPRHHPSLLEPRVDLERHGAIRVGSGKELATIRRMFAVMGMEPVGYYDLSVAGLPVHSTGFRPLSAMSLRKNPFRMFVSLLRVDMIEDEALRDLASNFISNRHIVTTRGLDLIEKFETAGKLQAGDAAEFVGECLETFRWHSHSPVDIAQYQALQSAHPLIADIVCFKGPHINHLTPRVLDIDTAQALMTQKGLKAKSVIEGPPPRMWPILLRQTSFEALEEEIVFQRGGMEVRGTHTARFGELEQRGIALTPKGRALYGKILGRTNEESAQVRDGTLPEVYMELLSRQFEEFPDDLDSLRLQGLAYFTYTVASNVPMGNRFTIDEMVESGVLKCEPITYEDFLPVSAAGIFASNIGKQHQKQYEAKPDQAGFEACLGCGTKDIFETYSTLEQSSIRMCFQELESRNSC